MNTKEWVVADVGSHSLRFGFSGAPRPSFVVPTRAPQADEKPQDEGEGQGAPGTEAASGGPTQGSLVAVSPFAHITRFDLVSLSLFVCSSPLHPSSVQMTTGKSRT